MVTHSNAVTVLKLKTFLVQLRNTQTMKQKHQKYLLLKVIKQIARK